MLLDAFEEVVVSSHCFAGTEYNGKWNKQPGPYFIKVKIILSLKFKINLIFYLIKEFMKHSCLNFFYEIVNKISIKVKRN